MVSKIHPFSWQAQQRGVVMGYKHPSDDLEQTL